MGHAFPRGEGVFQADRNPDLKEHMPRSTKTTNNKLQLTARSLELIYTVTDWPPGAPVLSVSLKESGKSRADLWQFAGNVGLENAIGITNDNCRLGNPQNPEIHQGEVLQLENVFFLEKLAIFLGYRAKTKYTFQDRILQIEKTILV